MGREVGLPEERHLRFRIGRRWYGLSLLEVSQVAPLRGIREVPKTPPFIRGLMEFQGRLLTILDAGRLLEGESPDDRNGENVLVLSRPFQHLALAIPGNPDVGTTQAPPATDSPGIEKRRQGRLRVERFWTENEEVLGMIEADRLARHCQALMELFLTAASPSATD